MQISEIYKSKNIADFALKSTLKFHAIAVFAQKQSLKYRNHKLLKTQRGFIFD